MTDTQLERDRAGAYLRWKVLQGRADRAREEFLRIADDGDDRPADKRVLNALIASLGAR